MATAQKDLFVSQILSEGQTGVMDRGYQGHARFDQWQQDNQVYLSRIKASTRKTVLSLLLPSLRN